MYKIDCAEAPHTVYNELVAMRLANLSGVAVASGVLASGPNGLAYVSLMVGAPGVHTPNINPRNSRAIVNRYRQAAGRLIVFDQWIGNRDRHGNVKAVTSVPRINFFAAFDHSHAILGAAESTESSLKWLEGEIRGLNEHPFAAHLNRCDMEKALAPFQQLNPLLIREACCEPLLTCVPEAIQARVGDILVRRRDRLPMLLERFPK